MWFARTLALYANIFRSSPKNLPDECTSEAERLPIVRLLLARYHTLSAAATLISVDEVPFSQPIRLHVQRLLIRRLRRVLHKVFFSINIRPTTEPLNSQIARVDGVC